MPRPQADVGVLVELSDSCRSQRESSPWFLPCPLIQTPSHIHM